MKIILLKDVSGIGRKDEIKNVSDGYALNMLFPRGLAAKLTDQGMAELERRQNDAKAAKQAESDIYKTVIRQLQKEPLSLSVASNEKGHLFKAVHEKDIVEAIFDKHHVHVPVELITIDQIKEAGDHRVTVKLGNEQLIFKVNVLKKDK